MFEIIFRNFLPTSLITLGKKTKEKYLGNDLNISKMYRLYLEECQENGFGSESIAKEWLDLEIFNYGYNYSFKSPDNDTCALCDQLQLQIREAESPDSQKRLQAECDQHLADSNNRYKMKSEDKEKSRKNLLENKVIMIDLQKCLPVPDLHNSQSFYSLMLWIYNQCHAGRKFHIHWFTKKMSNGEMVPRPWLIYSKKEMQYFVSHVYFSVFPRLSK
nr:unnamed protein product [Callosobruchus analis]